mgnify:CR=1 FL=1
MSSVVIRLAGCVVCGGMSLAYCGKCRQPICDAVCFAAHRQDERRAPAPAVPYVPTDRTHRRDRRVYLRNYHAAQKHRELLAKFPTHEGRVRGH